MTLPAKLGFGTLALSSVGGLGYVGTKYFSNDESSKVVVQPKTIKQLIDERYTHILLSTDKAVKTDDSYWANNWAEYKKINQSKPAGKDAFQLPSWTAQIGDGVNLISELKTKCATLNTSTNSSSYENVTKYCSRDVTITDQATKEGLVIINEDASQPIWKTREGQKNNLAKELKALGVEDSSQVAATISQKCIDAKTKKKSDRTYKDTYEAYKKVCAKKDTEQ